MAILNNLKGKDATAHMAISINKIELAEHCTLRLQVNHPVH
jgi:hypothetical protein